MEAHILNNLAFASWMHLIELPKTIDEEVRKDVTRDESHVISYLKQSIELIEKTTSPSTDSYKL